MGYGGYGFRWAPYVSVGQKLAMAKKKAAQVAKKQMREPSPVELKGRKIATSFWGKAWCDNLEAYSDFSNRLPRGATYVRNGSVVDLIISKGAIEAIVAGSEPYTVKITISGLAKATWAKIKKDCSASIDSLIDLLSGRLSDGVMRRLTEKKSGCFPAPSEIKLKCSCPDYSYCCKHIAAVMYGIGSRLDTQPELLFLLRGIDHLELISQAVSKRNLDSELAASSSGEFNGQDLGEIFGIELETKTPKSRAVQGTPKKRSARAATKSSESAVHRDQASRTHRKGVADKASLVNTASIRSPSVKPKAKKAKSPPQLIVPAGKTKKMAKAATKATPKKAPSIVKLEGKPKPSKVSAIPGRKAKTAPSREKATAKA